MNHPHSTEKAAGLVVHGEITTGPCRGWLSLGAPGSHVADVLVRKKEDAPAHCAATELRDALKLALEYWAHRQQRYKNRAPRWVVDARAAILSATKGG